MGKKLPTAQQEFVGEFAKQYEIAMGAKDILERLKTESL